MGGKKNEWNDLLTQFPDDIQNGEMWGILFTTSVESWIIQKKSIVNNIVGWRHRGTSWRPNGQQVPLHDVM